MATPITVVATLRVEVDSAEVATAGVATVRAGRVRAAVVTRLGSHADFDLLLGLPPHPLFTT